MTRFQFTENGVHLLTVPAPSMRDAKIRFMEIVDKFKSEISIADVTCRPIDFTDLPVLPSSGSAEDKPPIEMSGVSPGNLIK